MDELISAVAKILAKGISVDKVHRIILSKGWSEEDAFLAIKAGQNLHDSLAALEKELQNKPPPFGRKL